MNREVKAVDLNERCTSPDEDDQEVRSIIVRFAIPIWLSPARQRQVGELIQKIVEDSKNTPTEGIHWLSTVSGDERFYGLHFDTSARSFNSEEERASYLEARRPSEFTCPKCGGHAFGSYGGVGGWVRYCNGRGQRVKMVGGKSQPIEGPDEPTIRCDFTWPQSDDRKYGLKPPDGREFVGTTEGI